MAAPSLARQLANRFPPTSREGIGGDYIVLKREPQSPTVVVVLPSQDSYEMDGGDELERYLQMLEIPDSLHIRDYVWNFYAAKVDLTDMSLEPLSVEQASSFLKKPVMVTF